MPATPRRRPRGGTHSTTASAAPCQHCRKNLLYAWDEGLLVRVDADEVGALVGAALRGAGRRIYALTLGRSLIHESADRVGSLRAVVSRHAEHACPRQPRPAPHDAAAQTALFEINSPATRRHGLL